MQILNFERAADRAAGPRLTEAELDRRIAERESAVAAAMAQRLLPAGCDQQGRYPTRPAAPPQAAEACSELGAEPDALRPPMTRLDLLLLLAALLAGLAAEWWLVNLAIDVWQAWGRA